ncbi:hypothetical protein C8F01DRAFT_1245959 [Mycena amicta]|nr:hypothetical protein C8F01DRAFT_1245959 [Mycena amicta]
MSVTPPSFLRDLSTLNEWTEVSRTTGMVVITSLAGSLGGRGFDVVVVVGKPPFRARRFQENPLLAPLRITGGLALFLLPSTTPSTRYCLHVSPSLLSACVRARTFVMSTSFGVMCRLAFAPSDNALPCTLFRRHLTIPCFPPVFVRGSSTLRYCDEQMSYINFTLASLGATRRVGCSAPLPPIDNVHERWQLDTGSSSPYIQCLAMVIVRAFAVACRIHLRTVFVLGLHREPYLTLTSRLRSAIGSTSMLWLSFLQPASFLHRQRPRCCPGVRWNSPRHLRSSLF